MKRILMSVTLIVAFVAIAGLAGAQSLTGTVTGRVADEQGGVLPGVNVTLTGKQGAQTQVTDARGEFRFVGLEPGAYEVKAELQGFKPQVESGIQVSIGRTAEVRLTLGVGGLAETVEVTANAVTIDTTTTATDTAISKDMLFSMPLTQQNPSVNLLNYSPGVNDGSAFGGTSDYGNALLLDGVDTRDPAGGSAWTFYGFNMVEEVQVAGLGQPAEYGGFSGAVVNTITKSGGNRFSSLFEYRYTNKDLAGDNTSDAIAAQNPGLATPSRWDKMVDYTVQLGGPIKKDKLFFFGSVQRYYIKEDPDGPRTIRTEVSPRFNAKLTANLTKSDTLTGAFQYDWYNQKGRTQMGGAAASTDYRTANQDSPEAIWNVQYRKVFGASTFLEAKFTGYWGYYYVDPVHKEPAHLDWSGEYSGGSGYTFYADRGRNQVNVSLSKYAQKLGSHTFKFGVEIERSKVRDQYAYSELNGVPIYYYDYYGSPYLAYSYSYDLEGKNRRESYFAQDQWKMGRVTLNLGFRLDNIRGYSPALKETLYDTKSPQPRLGIAWDVTGKGTSVLKAFYGHIYEGPQYYNFSRALPGISDYVMYAVNPDWSLGEELSRTSGASKYRMGSDLKHPRTDEFNVSYEQQFLKNYKFTGTYIHREAKNFIDSVCPDCRWSPFAYTNPLNGSAMTLYEWANADQMDQEFEIRNIDGFQYRNPDGAVIGTIDAYRHYNGAMLVLQRALRNRWQAQVSYVYSKTDGTVNNDGGEGLGSTYFEHPVTALINRKGVSAYDRTHEVKIFAGYQIPIIEVGVNGFLSIVSGYPCQPYARIGAGALNWSASKNVYLAERGSYRSDRLTMFDFRAEKVFNFAPYRLGIYMDAQNLFNRGTVTGIQTRYPSAVISNTTIPFGGPTAVQSGRQITFGGRFSF